MAIPTNVQAAIDRVNAANNNAYNAVSNPNGLGQGGHRQNYIPNFAAMVTLVDFTGDQAVAAAQNAGLTAEDAGNTKLDRIAVSEYATQAATSATNAANALDAFNDRMLGAKAADPVQDNDGNAFMLGAMYFNTTEGVMKVWNGAAWQVFIPGATGYYTKAQVDALIAGISFDAINASITSVSLDALRAAQQARLNALFIAELRGDRLNMVDGIVDPYTDASDINAGQSSNYIFNAAAKWFEAVPLFIPPSSTIGSPANSGNPTQYGAAKAFDGDKTNGNGYITDLSGAGVANNAFIGQNFGSPKAVKSVKFYNFGGQNGQVQNVDLQYSDNGSTWTKAVSAVLSVEALAETTFSFPDVGAHQYWRLLAKSTPINNGSSSSWFVREIEFFDSIQPMTIRSAVFASDVTNPTLVRLAVQVSPPVNSGPIVLNTELVSSVSRNGGTTFTPVTLSLVETLADGTTLYEGFADISGQPAGSSMVYRHVTANAKDVRISGTIMQWRA